MSQSSSAASAETSVTVALVLVFVDGVGAQKPKSSLSAGSGTAAASSAPQSSSWLVAAAVFVSEYTVSGGDFRHNEGDAYQRPSRPWRITLFELDEDVGAASLRLFSLQDLSLEI